MRRRRWPITNSSTAARAPVEVEAAAAMGEVGLVQAVGELVDDRTRQSPGQLGEVVLDQAGRPWPAPQAALITAENCCQFVRSSLSARRPFAVS